MSNLSKANDDKGTSDSIWPPAVKDDELRGEIAASVISGARPSWHPLDISVLWSFLGLTAPFVLLVPLLCLQDYWLTISMNNDGDAKVYHAPTTFDMFETWAYADAFSLAICGVALLILFGKLIKKNRLTAALFFIGYSVSASLIAVFHEYFTLQLVTGLH